MLRITGMALLITILLPLCAATEVETRPLVLIFAPNAPAYGAHLKALLEEDPRIDGEIEVLESPEIFRVKMYFPNVKLAIVALSLDLNEGIGGTLEWYFSHGGGLVGLGFAGSKISTSNASANVFPVFGSAYVAGAYDPKNKAFAMDFLKAEEDEISNGLGDFRASNHKLVLSYNGSANAYLPRHPEGGHYKIVYTEAKTGAPAIVKYEKDGVSVTFACFGGDDIEKGANYFGKFADTTEFRQLFTNSAVWAWEHESKFEGSMSRFEAYHETAAAELASVLEEAEDLERASSQQRLLRTVVTIALAGVGVVLVYWATFIRSSPEE